MVDEPLTEGELARLRRAEELVDRLHASMSGAAGGFSWLVLLVRVFCALFAYCLTVTIIVMISVPADIMCGPFSADTLATIRAVNHTLAVIAGTVTFMRFRL